MSESLDVTDAATREGVAAMQRGKTLLAQPGFFGVLTVTGLSVVMAVLLLAIVNVALITSGSGAALGFLVVLDLVAFGSLAFFAWLPFSGNRAGPGEKYMVGTVAAATVVFHVIALIVVNLSLLDTGGMIALGIIDVAALAGVVFGVYAGFSSGGSASEQLLAMIVGIGSLLFLLFSLGVVNVAMIDQESIIVAAVIDVFALATVGWAVMKGTRG
ncbi:MAG: hypothetical protein ACFCGT_02805 [Sandaracinaceae bacterium]